MIFNFNQAHYARYAHKAIQAKLAVLSLVAGLTLSSTQAIAQSNTQTNTQSGDNTLDNLIVVTASRLPEPINQVLGSVIVIQKEQIESAMASDVAELLEQLGTVDVIHNGGPGQSVSVFLRGANSNQTLVLMDGVRLNPATIGVASLQNIAPALVDHIEIIQGPRSSLYGSDAMGGVINIITKAPNGSGGDVSTQWSSFNTRTEDADIYHGDQTADIFGAFHREDSHGYPTQIGDPTDRGFHNGSYFLKANALIDGTQVAAETWHASGQVDYSDLYSTPIGQRQQFDNARSSISVQGSLLPATHSSLMVSQLTDNLMQLTSPDYETTHRTQIDASTDVWYGSNKIIGGALLNFENAKSSVYGTNFDVSDQLHTFYVEDRFHAQMTEAQAAVAVTHSSVFGNHVTWNAGAGVHLSSNNLLSLTAGSAFRAPDATDLYGFGGNTQLKPETSNNLELSFTSHLSSHELIGLTAYEHRIADLITYTYIPTADNPYNGMNENVDRALIKGVETHYEIRIDDWRFNFRGERQEALDDSNGGSLLRRAHGMGALTLARTFGPWDVQGEWLVVGPRDDIDATTYLQTTNGGYALFNLGAKWQLSPNFSVQGRIENVFDKNYQTANGYLSPGRVLKASFRYAWH